jgi:hypothetical protein
MWLAQSKTGMGRVMNTSPVTTSKLRFLMISLSIVPPIVFVYLLVESKILFYPFLKDVSFFIHEWVILLYLFAPFIFCINNTISSHRLSFAIRLYKKVIYVTTALIILIFAGAYYLG